MYRLYLPGYSDGIKVLPTTYSPSTASTTGYPVPGTTYLGLLWTRMLDIGHYDHKAEAERGNEKGVNCMDIQAVRRPRKALVVCTQNNSKVSSPLSSYYWWQMSGSYWVLELKR